MKAHELYTEACTVGHKAALAAVTTSMNINGYSVEGGVCGFAYINIKPARGPLVTFLKAENIGRKSYTGGYDIGVTAYGQSLARKEAYANAFAKVLRDNGISAYGRGMID
jgi:hypothetical protein